MQFRLAALATGALLIALASYGVQFGLCGEENVVADRRPDLRWGASIRLDEDVGHDEPWVHG